MVIGVDFDNTVVSYDRLFHKLALERGLIPAHLPASKGQVRDYLRAEGHEQAWIELQGLGYGERMSEAEPFPGVIDCLRSWMERGWHVRIVSHKTRQPYAGDGCDLQVAARRWLEEQAFHEPCGLNLSRSSVYFELTKQDKLWRIEGLGCAWFVDDLPEFLGESTFPKGVQRVLFDPSGQHREDGGYKLARSWAEVQSVVAPEFVGSL